jgi:hypothetical protein
MPADHPSVLARLHNIRLRVARLLEIIGHRHASSGELAALRDEVTDAIAEARVRGDLIALDEPSEVDRWIREVSGMLGVRPPGAAESTSRSEVDSTRADPVVAAVFRDQAADDAAVRGILVGIDKTLDAAGVPASSSVSHRIELAVERLAELHAAGLDRESADEAVTP